MAEGKEIVIKIVGEEATENKKIDPTGEKVKKTSEKSTDDIFDTATMSYVKAKIANTLKGVVISEAKYQLNKYYTLTDDYLGQQNMNIALNVGSKLLGTAIAVKAGASVAGIPGAIAALFASGITTGFQIAHNYEQERIKVAKMNAELQFNRQRAGYSLTAGSIGENR